MDPAISEYVGWYNHVCENPTNCKGLSTWFGGSCAIDCLPKNPCYFYNDQNGNPDHMNICAVDTSTGELLENPLICSNPLNCEGISTLQADEFSWFPDICDIDCVPPEDSPSTPDSENLDPCYSNGDPNLDKMCGEGFECKNWTNCEGISRAEGGSCHIWCVPSNPCYFYSDLNGIVEHRNICTIDLNTGEALENSAICSNPTNCEGRSTIQGGQCEIDCLPLPDNEVILDPCYSNGDSSSNATICDQGFKCINPTNCNGLNVVEGGPCQTICEDDRDPCMPYGIQENSCKSSQKSLVV